VKLYELTINGHKIIFDESKLKSSLVFNSGFKHKEVEELILNGQVTVKNKNTQNKVVVYKLKLIKE
jgi:hypothetical protein